MKNKYPYPTVILLFTIVTLLTLLPACYQRQAFYVSPFNGNTGNYQTIPLRADSIRAATYASAVFETGSANENGKDYFNAFNTSLSRSHNLGVLQAYYGLDLTLGSYITGIWGEGPTPNGSPFGPNNPTPNHQLLNQYAGNHFFGGAGFNGGMNLSAQFYKREWRYLGFETSLNHEFGRYLQLRQVIPDSAADLIIRNNFFGTIGITSEFLGQTRTGQFGFKWAGGWVLGPDYNNLGFHDNESGAPLRYHYFNFTFHYSWSAYTSYIQLNSATKATGLHIGFNYRL